MMPSVPSGTRVGRYARRGENKLPRPFSACVWVLPSKRVRREDFAKFVLQVLLVLCPYLGQVTPQRFRKIPRTLRRPTPCPFPSPHRTPRVTETDILPPYPDPPHQARPAPVERPRHKPVNLANPLERHLAKVRA